MRIPEQVLNRLLTSALRRQPGLSNVRSEVPLGPGMRADIVADQHDGSVVLFEIKARPLRAEDVVQVCGYARCLEAQGHTVYAHLVGDGWSPTLERPDDIVFMDWSYFWGRLG